MKIYLVNLSSGLSPAESEIATIDLPGGETDLYDVYGSVQSTLDKVATDAGDPTPSIKVVGTARTHVGDFYFSGIEVVLDFQEFTLPALIVISQDSDHSPFEED